MKNKNYIQLNRVILDNPTVCKDSEYFAIWVYLLLKATHTSLKREFNKKTIELKAGQLITGRKKIAEQFGISESKVQRVLKKLEIEQQIEQQTSSKNRLITVKNWSKYQGRTTNRTTSEQPVNTNNKDNKVIIKEYNNIPELSNIAKLTDKRTTTLNARIKEYSYEQVLEVISNVSKSDFLKGNNDREWKCNFDWIMNSNNFIKILEGNYKNKHEEDSNDPFGGAFN